MKRLDLENNGGLPTTQYTLKWIMDGHRDALLAIAQMIGDNVIVYGCEHIGANVTNGWVVINGELLQFVGGPYGTGAIKVDEVTEDRTFDDTTTHTVYFNKRAILQAPGDINYTDLQKMSNLINLWQPGDIKQKYCDMDYIAANFDIDGYGLNREKGWRILTSVFGDAAGSVFVNIDAGDPDIDEPGNVFGAKTHTLTIPQIPAHTHLISPPSSNSDAGSGLTATGNTALGGDGPVTPYNSGSAGGGNPHNNMQKSFAVLTLIKIDA